MRAASRLLTTMESRKPRINQIADGLDIRSTHCSRTLARLTSTFTSWNNSTRCTFPSPARVSGRGRVRPISGDLGG